MKLLKLSLLSLVIFTSCDPFGDNSKKEIYTPILMYANDIENSIAFSDSSTILNPGKIYYKHPYIFIVEKYMGVHIINNINALSPVSVGYISVPGVVDVSVKENTLYADNARDLVAINITDIKSPVVTSRIKDVFPELLPPNSDAIPDAFKIENREANTVIVGWELQK